MNTMNKRFLAILIVIVVGLGGIYWLTTKNNKVGVPSSKAQASNHLFGQGKKGVTLIEYGDYQCPACGAYYPLVKDITNKYQADITFQFRNFPLVQLHQNAFASARAAEAASKQNKFWEMHDTLYEQQKTWETSSNPYGIFAGYAGQLGLDLAKFKQDYESTEVNDVINADAQMAQALGATGTPTFVLDGKKLDQNPQDEAAFSKLIDGAIKSKNQ